RGFVCKEADGDEYLARRAFTEGHAAVVIDYVRLGGSPLCRPIKLLDWCREQGCELLGELRACVDLPPIPKGAAGAPAEALVKQAISALQGETVTPAAPDEPVLVRVVAVAATCADIEAGGLDFDCTKLIGCANSCPVYLPAVEEVPLDLDVSGDHCEDAVVVCASRDLGAPETACPGP
ncbi:MAG: hypothetical protein R3B70_30125, partial [Polyangiaceae bacterium]